MAEALVRWINEPLQCRRGAPGLPLALRAYIMIMKQFHFMTYVDLANFLSCDPGARRLGLVQPPCVNTLSALAADARLIPVFRDSIAFTSSPARLIEKLVLVDGSGWPTTFSGDWFENRYGRASQIRRPSDYIKEHLLVGADTGLIAGLEVSTKSGAGSADTVHLRTLLETALPHWSSIKYVVGDKAYGVIGNFDWCNKAGVDLVTMSRRHEDRTSSKWPENAAKIAILEREHPELFAEIYRPRSKVEGVISRSKRKARFRRLQHRLTDPHVELPDVSEDDKITTWPQDGLRALVDAQMKAVGIARVNECYASHIADNIRALIVLEHLHDQEVTFVGNFAFKPIPTQRGVALG